MVIPSLTSLVYMFIPVSGPAGVDLTQYPVAVALVPEGTAPQPSDWQAATWKAPDTTQPKQAALLIGPGAAAYAAAEYMSWVQITAGVEQPQIPAGRVRIGVAG